MKQFVKYASTRKRSILAASQWWYVWPLPATLKRYSYVHTFGRINDIIVSCGRPLGSTVSSLSGHFQQRPHSLIRPQIFFAVTTSICLLFPLTKCHLSNVAAISWQKGGLVREELSSFEEGGAIVGNI